MVFHALLSLIGLVVCCSYFNFFHFWVFLLSQNSFQSIKLHPLLLQNLESLGYLHMTPVQAESLPVIVEGKDVIAQAKTGSGKTAAFGLGLLHKLDVKKFRIQTLILCPTRELADQVAKELRKLARSIHNIKILTLCGGMPFGPQLGSLEHGAHIVVGTPGRIEEHVRKRSLKLDHVTTLVLDEADRMLDMGFQESLDTIIGATPANRQTLLFSATYPPEIEDVAQRVMIDPVMIKVVGTHDNATIKQRFFKVAEEKQRMSVLRLLLRKYKPDSAIVFCQTKRETAEVANDLCSDGFYAIALNGDMEQKARDQALVRFANKSVSILVATDVAARGLDIDNLDAVINYQITRDTEVHVHRVGRTGRAGGKGLAISLYTAKEEYKVKQLEEYLSTSFEPDVLPPWSLLEKPSYSAPMATLQIDGGKKQKLRAGDILGALTGDHGIAAKQVGKIHIFDNSAYVAIDKDAARPALRQLTEKKLKGRSFRVRRIS